MPPLDPRNQPIDLRDASNAQQPRALTFSGGQLLRSGSQSGSLGYGNPSPSPGFPSPSLHSGGKERTGQ
jgi:hypothetical protein